MNEYLEFMKTIIKSPLFMCLLSFMLVTSTLRLMCNTIRYDTSTSTTNSTKNRLLSAYDNYTDNNNCPTVRGFIDYLAANDLPECIDLYTQHLDTYNKYWGL